MSTTDSVLARAMATAIVQTAAATQGGQFTDAQLAPVVQAVAEDLESGAVNAIENDARLAKIERQTRVLAEAVLAIAETSDSLGVAVRAVKDEM